MVERIGPAASRADQIRLAGWLAIPEPLVVEVAARAGYDWVGLDLQHGGWDLGLAFRGIQLLDALAVPALVRVSEEDLHLIPRVLDHGATGIVLAMASSPEAVAAAIERARYAPHGRRSYGGQRFGLRPEPADLAEVRPAIYAMVEDRHGVAAVGEIAAIPGLAGLHVGPVDLGLGLGLGRDRSGPVFREALEAIVRAGREAGLPVAMHAVRAEDADHWLSMGFSELVLTADIEILRTGLAGQLAAARALTSRHTSTTSQATGDRAARQRA
jgi:4-hydroxy-2-oxoheptanedioate aldolase